MNNKKVTSRMQSLAALIIVGFMVAVATLGTTGLAYGIFVWILEYDISIKVIYWVCFFLTIPLVYAMIEESSKEVKPHESKKEEI
ncbi:hypothetical protein MCCARTNEY_180 [Bacillus phage vB_BanH_McCartney]|nr:hypothetical protein MCCARTNEY_180 [Bacillus phage vB_BanH_McCartney]